MKFFSKLFLITLISFLGLTGMSYGQHSSKMSVIKELIGSGTLERFFLLKQMEDQNCLPYDVNTHIAPDLLPLPLSYLGDLKTTKEGSHEFIQIHFPGLEEGQEAWLELGKDEVIWISAAMEKGEVQQKDHKGAEDYCQKKSEELGLKGLSLPENKDFERLREKFKVAGRYEAQILPKLVGNWFWSGSVRADGRDYAYNFYGVNGHIYSDPRSGPYGRVMCVVPVASLR